MTIGFDPQEGMGVGFERVWKKLEGYRRDCRRSASIGYNGAKRQHLMMGTRDTKSFPA